MTQTKKETFDLEEGQLYYEIAGEGEPIVLSHAGFLDSRMFDTLWESLAQYFMVIRYDMRGFGKSSPANGPICRRDDLAQLVKHLGITQTHLVGCSIGGQVCLDLALEKPQQVKSLTLVDAIPSGFELQGMPPRYLFEMFDALKSGDMDRASELQIRIWLDGEYRDPGQVDPQLRKKALDMIRIPVKQNTYITVDMQPIRPLDPPAITRLETVNCPTLIVAGSLDNHEILRAAEVMVTRIPGARKVILEGSGHVPIYEQPENSSALLLEFLSKVS